MEDRSLDEAVWNRRPLGKMAHYLCLFIIDYCRNWDVNSIIRWHKLKKMYHFLKNYCIFARNEYTKSQWCTSVPLIFTAKVS